jgi:hypothetical protein
MQAIVSFLDHKANRQAFFVAEFPQYAQVAVSRQCAASANHKAEQRCSLWSNSA